MNGIQNISHLQLSKGKCLSFVGGVETGRLLQMIFILFINYSCNTKTRNIYSGLNCYNSYVCVYFQLTYLKNHSMFDLRKNYISRYGLRFWLANFLVQSLFNI